MTISPSTWKLLGLSVAAGYATLGSWMLLAPRNAAERFFAPKPSSAESLHSGDLERYVPMLGARDLSMALAMGWYAYEKNWRAMGQMILAGMLLCGADAWATWNAKGAGK